MKKDFSLESYAYNQLLQVVIHEQMFFVSSILFLSKWHPNNFIFFNIQHKNKVFNNIKVVIYDPFQVDLLI
jgi:hypothetical protein